MAYGRIAMVILSDWSLGGRVQFVRGSTEDIQQADCEQGTHAPQRARARHRPHRHPYRQRFMLICVIQIVKLKFTRIHYVIKNNMDICDNLFR